MQLLEQLADSANPELLSAFVKHMPTAVAMLDRDLRYLVISRRWLADYGLENQNIIGSFHYEVFPLFRRKQSKLKSWGGKSVLDSPLITCDPLEGWREIYALCLAGKTSRGSSDYFARSDGSPQRIKWEIQPWRTSTGEIGGVVMFTELQEFSSSAEALGNYIDITEQNQMEAALLESEERFRATFEQAAVGISHTTPEGKFLRVNQKFCNILGYTRKELLELSLSDITHPEDLSVDLEYGRSLLAGEIETCSRDARYLRQDGSFVWVQITASLVYTSQDTPRYFLNVIQDISERKAAESALRQSEAKLRERVQREALLNRLATQIRHSLQLDIILETTAQEIRQILEIDRCQFACYHSYGPQPYWRVLKEACNPDLSDFTGRYSAEFVEPLSQHLLNLEILRIDNVESLDNQIKQNFAHVLGYTSLLLLPMQTPSGHICVISCSHSSGVRPWTDSEVELLQAVRDQLLIAIKQADLYAESCMATEQAQEKATQLQQTLQELQLTQAKLIQSEKMSSLGQLVAGVAHEINNPVNFIYANLSHAQQYFQDLLGLVQLYQATYPESPQEIQEYIEEIDLGFLVTDLDKLQNSMKVGAERIREIVKSLQTFSRSDGSDSKLVDIHSGIESTLSILQYRLKAKRSRAGISIIKEYGDLPTVECYPGPLNQVFMNLLTNAIDALEEQVKTQPWEMDICPLPTITIKTGLLSKDSLSSVVSSKPLTEELSEENSSLSKFIPHIFIRITDNGPGMTQKTRKQLFDPFFTTKAVGQGTGLGLAISYQIITERHGGQLRCNSIPGKGSEFIVEIPIRQDSHRVGD
ncbi:PAS domain S-box protein [Lyngbya aestuarii]|uniref:PAS domain S-box protein n=1 Tax=Lyngbya aestuarii TaxID=118322 RepID=UPI00403D66A5